MPRKEAKKLFFSDNPEIVPTISPFPKADYFVNHAFERYGDLSTKGRIAYMQALAQVLIADEGVFNHA